MGAVLSRAAKQDILKHDPAHGIMRIRHGAASACYPRWSCPKFWPASRESRVNLHDLRRTHGTTVTALGFSREQMNRIQNQAEGVIASVYDRHNYAHEACEIQRAVTSRLMALIEGRSPDNVVELNRARS
jgi:hypothetical protein